MLFIVDGETSAAPIYPFGTEPACSLDGTLLPAAGAGDRVEILTQQLDVRLTDKLAQIRARIAPDAGPNAAPALRLVDVSR